MNGLDEAKFRLWLLGQLRRISYKQPDSPGSAAFSKARVKYGFYKCSNCGESFGPKEVHKEHTSCVVPLEGFDSWDGIISRMFCRRNGLQDNSMLTIMCKPCHKVKTKGEAAERARLRRLRAKPTTDT